MVTTGMGLTEPAQRDRGYRATAHWTPPEMLWTEAPQCHPVSGRVQGLAVGACLPQLLARRTLCWEDTDSEKMRVETFTFTDFTLKYILTQTQELTHERWPGRPGRCDMGSSG